MAKGKKDKPTRKERRAQKKHILLGDDGEDLDTQLKVLGLTTKCITGDGNCLFRALSDQYYGYDKHHKAIRQEVCQYLGQNKDTYQFFVEDDIPFDRYLENMRQDGCFGGHMIIVGFAKLRQVDVKIYQPGLIYVIHGVGEDGDEQQNGLDDDDDDTGRQILHIAYHSWEHYSSVRNIDGPYNGMPEIKDNSDTNTAGKDIQNDDDDNDNDDADSPDSKEKVILTACPGTNIRKIRRLLRKYKGNPDKVIDALYEEQNKEEQGDTKQDATIPAKQDISQDNNHNSAQSCHEIQHGKDEATEATEVRQEKELDEGVKNNNTDNNKNDESNNDNTKVIPEVSTPPPPAAAAASSPPPPKRLTAQQRKQQAKLRQKEQKREKKQQAANKHVAAKMKNEKSTDTDNTAQQAMKQLHI
ncbi:hypothetical protein BCR42DRAFT_413269 [Absidia repens]|uniref:OTU domain-containing protein n=1 Tax=Absidia repens TaxID=90262 RepID=A0A1X2IKS7_9FUNG|nr:hypothetical protein BCR42DRAFT_413269 [Absidia repens]